MPSVLQARQQVHRGPQTLTEVSPSLVCLPTTLAQPKGDAFATVIPLNSFHERWLDGSLPLGGDADSATIAHAGQSDH
jgi:hypothetical protein